MDALNIIDMYNNVDDLDAEMNRWLNLTFDIRKRSDDACIEKYGCTNTERYNRMKALLVKVPDDSDTAPITLTPGSDNIIEAFNTDRNNIQDDTIPCKSGVEVPDTDATQQAVFNKIQSSNTLQQSDPNIVIINDFVDEHEPDYNVDDLVTLYNKYVSLPMNYKKFSDNYSVSIWGRTVPEMYTYMRDKLKSKEAVLSITQSTEDKVLESCRQSISYNSRIGDYLEYAIEAIGCLSKQSSPYKSIVMEGFVTDNPYPKEYDFKNDLPGITPFFSPDEYSNIQSVEALPPFSYVMLQDPKKYYSVIHDLQMQLKDPSKKELAEDRLLKLGWNPYVPINTESVAYARSKQLNWINMHEQCKIIDLHRYKSWMSTSISEAALDDIEEDKYFDPIYIILAADNKDREKYIKCGVSLEETLHNIYTFNSDQTEYDKPMKKETFADYAINQFGDSYIRIYCFFVEPETKDKIEKSLEWFYKNNDRSFMGDCREIGNISLSISKNTNEVGLLSPQAICSQFADALMILCNIEADGDNITYSKEYTRPAEILVYDVYEGAKDDYQYLDMINKVAALKYTLCYRETSIVPEDKVVPSLRKGIVENLNISCNNPKINTILKELKNTIKPRASIIVNELKVPFGFTKSGEFYVDLPKDLQNEYNEAHKLLSMYDETNQDGIKHELARLYYLNYVLEKKIKKADKKSPEYKELIDLRARVLNDFTTYFKILKASDPKFDFTEYMKTSEFYNKNMVVDAPTLKSSGKLITKFIKNLK